MSDDFFDSLVPTKWDRPDKDTVEFQEIVELFVKFTVNEIMLEAEDTPRFNIIFSDEALDWLRELLKTPYRKEGYYVPNMSESDIKRLFIEKQSNPDCPTVIVKDHIMFFKLLTEIMNEQVSLHYDYGNTKSARAIAIQLLRKLWLRMGADDFENVEQFLQRQLDFLKNREFDEPDKTCYLTKYNGMDITYQVEMSEIWCESTRRMHFMIHTVDGTHDLPYVYYDICEENGEKVCYIGAVQNRRNRNRIKSVERELYKLKSDIPKEVSDEYGIHPNFLMAMKLFYEVLRKHNITRIKVPVIQVLSYRYHEILSNNVEKVLSKWDEEKLAYMDSIKDSELWFENDEYNRLLMQYKWDKEQYDRFYGKEDFISKSKIEGLISLFINMMYLEDMFIDNEIFINAPYLEISLNSDREIEYRRK